MSSNLVETVRTGSIASAGVSYSFLGFPFADWAALATFIYIVIKIILLLPELKEKFYKRKKEKEVKSECG